MTRKDMKRLVSILVCLAMVLAVLPVASLAATETVRLYCVAPDGWTACYVYWWGNSEYPGWPGTPMTLGSDGIWYYDVPADATNVIFNNGDGTQTADLDMPSDENVMFDYDAGTWGPYLSGCGEGLTWELGEDGVLTITGSGSMDDFSAADPAPWAADASDITAVVIGEGVTYVGSLAFDGCSKVASIQFEGDAPSFAADVFSGVTATAYYYVDNEGWTSDLRQSYGGTITWVGRGLVGVELLSDPVLTGYHVGDTIDPADIRLEASFDDGSTRELKAEEITLGSCDMTTAGVKCLTVSYGRYAVMLDVQVHEAAYQTVDASLYPESDHNYSNNLDETKTLTIPGALEFKLTFSSSTKTESGCDFISVLDGDGNQIGRYCGTAAAGITVTVPGDTVKIRLTSDSSQTYYGYSFSSIQADQTVHAGETEIEGRDPTCSEDGYSGGWICDICGITYGQEDVVPALGHDYVAVVTAPTAEARGYTTHTCSRCGDSYQTHETIYGDVAYGSCGAELAWALQSDGVLTIVGEGAMDSYSTAVNAPWYGYRTDITSVVIEAGVTSISGFAFNKCSAISEVVVPETVTSIGQGAFSGCAGLVEMTLPFVGGSVKTASQTYQYPFGYIFGTTSYTGSTGTSQSYYGSTTSYTSSTTYYIPTSLKTVTITGGNILYGAFDDCSKLTSVTLPEDVTSIGGSAFYNCDGLTEIAIPEGVTSIGSSAFSDCDGLTEVTIPGSGTRIGNAAFYDCYRLTSVTIEDGVKSIGEYAFRYCSKLSDIVVPDSVTSIGLGAFNGCSNLRSITLPFVGGSVKTAEDTYQYPFGYVFGTNSDWSGRTAVSQEYIGSDTAALVSTTYYIPSSLRSVTITGGTILHGAFSNCSMLTSITLPEGADDIGGSAFYNCSGLTQIRIPDSVTGIADSAFYGCTGLTKLEIPASVAQIQSYGFQGCSALTEMIFLGTAPSFGANAFYGVDITAYYPAEDASWTAEVLGSYGGSAEWVAMGTPVALEVLSDAVIGGYMIGSRFDPSQIRVAVVYDNGISRELLEGSFAVGSPDMTTIGAKTVEVSYGGLSTYVTVLVHKGALQTVDPSLYPESSHNYANSIDQTKTLTVAGAMELKLTFSSSTRTEAGCDFIYVYDRAENLIEMYSDTAAAGITVTVPGDTVKILLTSDGSNVYYGYSFSQIQAVMPIHTGEETTEGMAPGCTTEGKTGDFVCEVCGEAVSGEIIPALGHDHQAGAVTAPTCTAQGYTTYTCTRCGDSYEADQVDALGHDYAVSYVVEATENSNGYTVYACSRCDSTREDDFVVFGEVARGTCGDSLSWVLQDDGVLTIFGTGAMTNYDSKYTMSPWWDYRDMIEKVIISKGATSIGSYAFDDCSVLLEVSIPEGVTAIGQRAFYGCSGMTKICLPDSLKSIGAYAFYGCGGLSQIVIPEGVTGISGGAFHSCTGLVDVQIPDGVTSIGGSAFQGCSSLVGVTIPASVTSVGDYAFAYCDSLQSITFLGGGCSIGGYLVCNSANYVDLVFLGDSPVFASNALRYEYVDVYYPAGNETWTDDVKQKYGGYPTYKELGSLTDMTVSVDPYYFVGEEVKAEDFEVKVTYSSGAVSWLRGWDFQVTACDTSTSGLKTVAVSYQGMIETMELYVHGGGALEVSEDSYPESDHNYGHSLDDTQVLRVPGASQIWITFSGSTYVENGYDYIYVYDISDQRVASFTGGNAAGVTVCVNGDTVKIRLKTDGSGNGYGYSLSQVSAVRVDHEGETMEAVDPTCTENGRTEGVQCQICGAMAGDYVIPALGHDYQADGTCSRCGEVSVSVRVYCKDSAGWGNVYAYVWDDGDSEPFGGWPGTSMYRIGTGECYYIDIPAGYSNIIFNCNGGVQTADLTIPVDGRNMYDNLSCSWSVYGQEEPEVPDDQIGGACGTDLTWGLSEDGVLTISGTGTMYDYSTDATAPWIGYADQIYTISIGSGVTSIGSYAFYNCVMVTSVEISGSVTNIGNDAFVNCTRLATIQIPDSVTNIGRAAFSGCTGLVSFQFPDSISIVSGSMFYGCQRLVSVVIPTSVTNIGSYAFYGCTSLSCITIPDSVTDLGSSIFENCTALTSIQIPDSVSYIGSRAFYGCTDLESVGKLGSVAKVNSYLFYDCSSLTDIQLPANVETIGSYAFYGCTGLTALTIPGGTYHIYTGAFKGCTGLTEMVIPDSVYDIDSGVFAGCTGLEEITLSFIGSYAWSSDLQYPLGYIFGTSSYEGGVATMQYYYDSGELVGATYYIPASLKSVTVTGGEINYGAFYNCAGLTEIVLPEGLEEIGNAAFYHCDSLMKICIPENVASIGGNAFRYCGSLRDISFLGDAPTFRNSYVFGGVTADVYYPAGNSTWTSSVMLQYDGTLTWIALYDANEGGTLTVHVDGAYESFDSVYVDGVLVDPEVYTVTAGSTIVTFDSDYVKNLRAGQHVVSVCYDDGSQIDTVVELVGTASVVQPTLTLKYPSLSFESEILYNVYYIAEDLDDVVEMGLATFDSEVTDGTVEDATDVIPGFETDGDLWKVGTNGISAKNLGDTLYFKVYAKLSDGSYVYSAMKSYSAVSYAGTILGRSTSSSYMKSLVVAMLNYGTEAQLFFGHNTDTLMNAGLTAEQQALVSAYDESMMDAVVSVDSVKAGSFVYDGSSFTRRAPTVSFDGAFAINYYFTAANAPDDGMTLYYWNSADYNAATVLTVDNATGCVEMVATDVANQYFGQVVGIAAKELDSTVFVVGVYEYEGVSYTTGVLNYSIGKYCEGIAANSASAQQALAQATAVYGYCAKEYFADL